MTDAINNRILGAVILGTALVGGAFLINRVSNPPTPQTGAVYVADSTLQPRAAIAVQDSNNDGIEDWQEPFLTAAPVILSPDTLTFERENTLTEQLSISLMEGYMLSRSIGGSIQPNSTVVSRIANTAAEAAKDRLYSRTDITVISDNNPQLIREYANTLALLIENNDIKDRRNEIVIFESALQGSKADFALLKNIGRMYAKNRDEMLKLPTPNSLAQQHLDLINVFHALSAGITAMSEAERDPAYALLRLKRYEDDMRGLGKVLMAIHQTLNQYPGLFSVNDPGLIFSNFAQLVPLPQL